MSIEKIHLCEKCDLCRNQQPLLQKNVKKASIFWVGLSAVKSDDLFDSEPLSPITNTGRLISEIEDMLPNFSFYKTNTVKCLPLDSHGKIRYPTMSEMSICFENMQTEIYSIRPAIVVLLGSQVSEFIFKQYKIPKSKLDEEFSYNSIDFNGINFLPVHHPSYIQIYKRKKAADYKMSISNAIQKVYA